MRRKVFALMAGSDSRHLLFCEMKSSEISVFIDESGRFLYPDKDSCFYVLGMVFHDQSQDITNQLLELSRSEAELGLEDHCFHAGPLIRKEKGYEFMSRPFRGKIFARMMAFASHVDFRYHCLYVDKRYISTQKQIVDKLKNSLVEFGNTSGSILKTADRIKIYYDCGQSPVTNMLHESFTQMQIQNVEFAQGVTPSRFRLFQLADLVCTVRLIELRLINGLKMTQSETRFFGGPRDFKRNVLKKLKRKEI